MPYDDDITEASTDQAAPSPRERVWTPLFVLITASALLVFMTGQGLNTGSSVYLARTGYPSAVAGASAFLFSIAAAVMRIVCGHQLDKRGRYGMLMAGITLFVAASAAPLLHLPGEAFLAMRVLQGIGFAMATTTSATMASDVLPVARLGEGLGFYGLGQALAMAIGPAVALFLVETDPAENVFVAITVMAVGAGICMALCRYEKHPERLPKTSGYRTSVESGTRNDRTGSKDRSPEQKRGLGAFLSSIFEKRAFCGAIPMLLYSPIIAFNIYFVGLFASQMGLVNGGVYYTFAAIAMVIVRLGSHLFMDRVAPVKILGFGLAMGMASVVLLFFISKGSFEDMLAPFCVAGFFYGLCTGLVSPVNQSVAVKNTPPERWGAANALVLFALDTGMGAAAVVWGFVNDGLGYSVTLQLCMAFLVATFVSALVFYPKEGK